MAGGDVGDAAREARARGRARELLVLALAQQEGRERAQLERLQHRERRHLAAARGDRLLDLVARAPAAERRERCRTRAGAGRASGCRGSRCRPPGRGAGRCRGASSRPAAGGHHRDPLGLVARVHEQQAARASKAEPPHSAPPLNCGSATEGWARRQEHVARAHAAQLLQDRVAGLGRQVGDLGLREALAGEGRRTRRGTAGSASSPRPAARSAGRCAPRPGRAARRSRDRAGTRR